MPCRFVRVKTFCMRKNNAKIVIIAGGSFQGKSLISLELAYKLKFSAVITTDFVRNILNVLNPNMEFLSTSTYMMSTDNLLKQKELVSEAVKKIIDIYLSRGEHIIVEGMHFSKEFLKWSSLKKYCNICIDNLLPLKDRLILKSITRSRLRFYDPESHKYYFNSVNKQNVDMTSYIQYQDTINDIHKKILESCKTNGYEIVSFSKINKVIRYITKLIKDWSHK